jgi:hypothetical protein
VIASQDLVFDDLWEPGQPLDGPELWASVQGYEGAYEVSTQGRLRRIAGGRGAIAGRILGQHPIWKAGHLGVSLCLCGRQKTFPAHKLVALAFIGPPPVEVVNGIKVQMQVHHMDGNNLNNRADNMEYISQVENLQEENARRYNYRMES